MNTNLKSGNKLHFFGILAVIMGLIYSGALAQTYPQSTINNRTPQTNSAPMSPNSPGRIEMPRSGASPYPYASMSPVPSLTPFSDIRKSKTLTKLKLTNQSPL